MPAGSKALRKLVDMLRARGRSPVGDVTELRGKSYWENIGEAPSGPLTLYHGSPHTFAPTDESPLGQFRISENLLKGEGAIAYGPGAYLTGDQSLAREYARNLANRKSGNTATRKLRTATFSPETAWGGFINEDPGAFLEYLRLRAALGARDMGEPLFFGDRTYRAFADKPNFTTLLQQLRTPGVATYLQRAAEAGVDLDALPRRLGRSAGPTQRRAMDAGERLRNALRERPLGDGYEPRIRTETLVTRPIRAWNMDEATSSSMLQEAMRKGLIPQGEEVPFYHGAPSRMIVDRNRLNSTNAAIAGRPGPNYRYSMDGVVDLSKLKVGDSTSHYRPNLYVAETPARPGRDLFSYDYPLWTNAPNLVDRLERVASPLELPRFNVERSGQDMIHKMTKKVGPLNTIKAFKDHEVPGMYYLKGGSRGYYASKDLPTRFVPDDYNFLFFDPESLKIIERKAKGGLV